MIFATIILGTLREAIAKKIFLGFFIIASLIILGFLFFVNLEAVEGMVDMMGASGEEQLRNTVIQSQVQIMIISYLLVLTLCLITVSSFVPSMLEKGNIDLLLSKPVSRSKLILGKFAGGVSLIFVSLVYLIGFVWLILSAKSGFWHLPFLYSILFLTFSFAVLYSLIILINLLTQSSILAILVGLFLVFIVTPILSVREEIIFSLIDNAMVKFVVNFFYYILPKPGDLNDIAVRLVLQEPILSYQPMISSLLFMLACLSISIFYFRKKDY
jgi:ABC-2 type transport system permease protein